MLKTGGSKLLHKGKDIKKRLKVINLNFGGKQKMANIKFLKFSDKETASKVVAQTLFDIFGSMPSSTTMVLGTATGQTPKLTYIELARFTEKSRWYPDHSTNLVFRQLDNYISPGSTEDNLPEYSYERELADSIWQVPNGGAYIPREWAVDPEEEAKRYAELIAETNAEADLIVQILGIGDEDGHIAFNMPGDPFDSTVHVVDLNEETIRANADKFFGGDTTKVPTRAITTGIGDILKSNIIFMEAFGKRKADIIWRAFFTEPTTEIPATALQTLDEDKMVIVVLDEESASTIVEKEGTEMFLDFEDVICECIDKIVPIE